MPVILYERQRQILDFLSQYIQKNNFAPSLKQIASAMGLRSLATVHEHLHQLSKKGVIKITGKGKNRRLEVIDKSLSDVESGMKLPILGLFTQGSSIEPYPKADAFFPVAPSIASGTKRCFILEVKDDALKEEGVFKSDLLVLEEESKIKDSELVIALLEKNIAGLYRFFQEATRVKLEAIKTEGPPLYASSVKIQGKLLALIRRF